MSHLPSALLPMILNFFPLKFCMGDPDDLTIDIYGKKKYSSKLTTFFQKLQSLFVASLIILFKFLFVYFPPGLKLRMNPKKRINFHSIKRISKFCSLWYLFKIKSPKSELNIWEGSFWTNVPPHTLKNMGVVLTMWGSPLMIEVMSTQNLTTFETLQTNQYLSSYPFHLRLK